MKIIDWINLHKDKVALKYDNNIDIGKRKLNLILEKALNLNRNNILFNYEKSLNLNEIYELNKYLNDLIILEKPIEYILNKTYFNNIELFIEEPILIPRQETEFWCSEFLETISKKNDSLKIADLCCGSGCIGIFFLKNLINSECIAIDIDSKAIELSYKNAICNNIQNRYQCLNIDLNNFIKDYKDKFDIILSNPPYISLNDYNDLDPSVKKWESKIALTDDYDGCYYIKCIIDNACNILKKNGICIIEIDSKNSEFIYKYAAEKNTYKNINIINDQYDQPRIIYLELTV